MLFYSIYGGGGGGVISPLGVISRGGGSFYTMTPLLDSKLVRHVKRSTTALKVPQDIVEPSLRSGRHSRPFWTLNAVEPGLMYPNWRASEASETLSGLFNRESRYMYILARNVRH